MILLLGVGNEMDEDDSFGVRVAKCLKCKDVVAVEAGTAPENFLDFVRKADVVVVADCVNMGEAPGRVRLLKNPKVIGNITSTHNLPLSMLMKFCKGGFYLLGYQAGGNVKDAVDEACEMIKNF